MAFDEKAIFIWNDATIGSEADIEHMLMETGFEAVYLHSSNISTWRTVTEYSNRAELAVYLKRKGYRVYASAAAYGDVTKYNYMTPTQEGAAMAGIVEQYQLDGGIFDVEKGLYETSTEAARLIEDMFKAYKAGTQKPSAFCGWSYYLNSAGNQIHPLAVLKKAMEYADVGMPMAYWYNGSTPANAVAWCETTYAHWRSYTNKPIVMAGRAYNDSFTATGPAVTAFEAKARELGASSVTWWDMEHGMKISDVWAALAALPKYLTGEPPATNPYKSYAMGYYTKTATWTNTGFNFIAGDGGDYMNGPNPDLKPIELRAASMGQHFFGFWNFETAYYTNGQFQADDAHWPPLENDWPYRRFVEAFVNRSPKAVIVRIMTGLMENGKPVDSIVLNFAAKKFIERVSDWLWKTKQVVVIIETSNGFIQQYAPGMNNWAHIWDSCIVQPATALDASYPVATDKPNNYISTRPTWEFWRYYNNLYLAHGDADWVANFLGEPTTPPVEPPPPDNPDYAALVAMIEALTARVFTLESQSAQHGTDIADINAKLDGMKGALE